MARDPWRTTGDRDAPGPGEVAVAMIANADTDVLVREVQAGRGRFIVSLRRLDGEWSGTRRAVYRLKAR